MRSYGVSDSWQALGPRGFSSPISIGPRIAPKWWDENKKPKISWRLTARIIRLDYEKQTTKQQFRTNENGPRERNASLMGLTRSCYSNCSIGFFQCRSANHQWNGAEFIGPLWVVRTGIYRTWWPMWRLRMRQRFLRILICYQTMIISFLFQIIRTIRCRSGS